MAQEQVSKLNIFAQIGTPSAAMSVSKMNVFVIVNNSPPGPPPPVGGGRRKSRVAINYKHSET